MNRPFALACVLITLASLAQPAAKAQSNLFQSVVAIAQSDSVRIDCRLTPSTDPAPVDLEAAITHAKTGDILWKSSIGAARRTPGQPVTITKDVRGLTPELWEPHSPSLYHLKITATKDGAPVGETTIRFGFRTIEIKNGQFHLNGRPIFLKGLAINPPGRTIPDALGESPQFARDYIAFLKSQNLNIFRISTDVSQTWFDAADELGMLMYAGRYGAPPASQTGKQTPPEDFEASLAAYRALFEQCASHPSIIIYYLANELPASGPHAAEFSSFLQRAHAQLKQWDPTRPYIANAGYGEGREGDICDVHRYWGWYYNSFLTYYNLRTPAFLTHPPALNPTPSVGTESSQSENSNSRSETSDQGLQISDSDTPNSHSAPSTSSSQLSAFPSQPITFSECVGAFTGSSGEINLVRSKQLAPRLGWLGNTSQPVHDSLAYQSDLVKQATETFRRLRPANPRLAGIMPFTTLFYNWSGIDSFSQMRPKPAMDQLRISYQPILLSWELWTPQAYAGARINPIAHIVNDHTHGAPITNATLRYTLSTRSGRPLLAGSIQIPDVPYYATWSTPIPITLPAHERTDDYLLCGTIYTPDAILSTNWTTIFIAEPGWGHPPAPPKTRLLVYDRAGRTTRVLQSHGLTPTPLHDITTHTLSRANTLVIGEFAWDDLLSARRQLLKDYVQSGGRILCLQQDPSRFLTDWLPAGITPLRGSASDPDYPPKTRPHREQTHLNPERPNHPVFLGLDRQRLAIWSDYTRWDQTQPGFPRIYPVTSGFQLRHPAEDLRRTAILADYDRGLDAIALCETFDAKGSVILSGLDLINRSGLDPVADRLLANLIAYAVSPDQHHPLPLITRPIHWGDLATEQGAVCGSINGLIINAEWLPGETQPSQPSLPANTGSWNAKPGDQFTPYGRNPFGPYEYTTGSSLRTTTNSQPSGEGFVLVRAPAAATRMLTIAGNSAKNDVSIRISVNGTLTQATIPPGYQKLITAPLPADKSLTIRFAGPKDLVLLETRFE